LARQNHRWFSVRLRIFLQESIKISDILFLSDKCGVALLHPQLLRVH
jgi:hypothetical protein